MGVGAMFVWSAGLCIFMAIVIAIKERY